jgi:EmrB/QacA subfamily drug resistance transporter
MTTNGTIAQTPTGAESPPDPRRWWVLAVMSIGTLIVFLDLTVVNTALPAISQDLKATTSDLQWVVDSYVLVLAGLLILAGSIGDRFGRKRWMTAGLIFFALGSAIGGLANSIPTLIAGRAVQGLGAAFVLPATLSIVTNAFPREERGKAIAVWTAVGGIGIGLGPAIGGYLVDRWDWSAAFWIHMPIIAIALVGQRVVAESRDGRQVGLDFPGAFTATFGISTLVFGVIQGTEEGWTSPLILGSFAASAILLAAFVAIELRTEYPMLPLHFFKRRDFTGSVLIIGLLFFAGPAVFFFMTQFFQIVQGRDPFEAGLLILPNAFAIVAASALAPRLGRSLGLRRTVVLSALIMAASLLLFAGIDADWAATTEIALVMLFGFGFGLGMPSLTDSIMASVPVEDAGVGSAVNDVSRELGSALGIAVLGSFINGIYRSDVQEQLEGQVPEEAIEIAREGIGVVAASAGSFSPDVAQTTFATASASFVDAMSSGFYLGAGILGTAAVIAAVLLPRTASTVQAERVGPATTPVLRIALDEPDLIGV